MAIKNNTKITAMDVLEALNVQTFTVGEHEYTLENIWGAVRIRIAGIRGIVSPDHLLQIPEGVTEISVMVGENSYTLETPENGDGECSERYASLV